METDETELQDSSEPEQEEEDEESAILKKNRQLFERAKKAEEKAKELESKIQSLEESSDDSDYPEENSAELKELRKKLAEIEERSEMDRLYSEYPALQERLDEFDEYRHENTGMPLNIAAKAFLVEKELLGQANERAGLEPARGGAKTPPQSDGMTSDEVRQLRENNYKEYMKLVRSGKLEIKE
jgi:DNA repair exonuclease SbcCD ATPase subunit